MNFWVTWIHEFMFVTSSGYLYQTTEPAQVLPKYTLSNKSDISISQKEVSSISSTYCATFQFWPKHLSGCL